MARSLFGENQIVDADLLTESEHLGTVHTDLVAAGEVLVSGTLTVTGTINCGTVVPNNGFTGTIPVVTNVTYEGVVSNINLSFEYGVLVGYTNQDDTYVSVEADNCLVISPEGPYLGLG